MPPQASRDANSLEGRTSALIVDSGTDSRHPVRELLDQVAAEVWEAEGFDAAWDMLRRHLLDVVVVGPEFPPDRCGRFLSEVCRFDDAIALISVVDAPERGCDALRDGAYDYFLAPVDRERLRTVLRHIGEAAQLRAQGSAIPRRPDGTAEIGGLCAHYPPMLRVLALVRRLSRYEMPVLVAGEEGTEKEEVARTLHLLGRQEGPFIVETAASLSPAGLGRACGAARGGTLFLDDVPALPAETAAALAAMVSPAAPGREPQHGVRIIAGCREEALARVEPATVREDLYARLSGAVVALPPLRERRDDVPLLARRLLRDLAESTACANELDGEVAELLRVYRWPGNVAELRNALAAAVGCAAGGRIEPDHLPPLLRERSLGSGDAGATRRLRDLEVQHLRQVLSETAGNKSRAARILGVSRWALQRRIRKHGLDLESGEPAEEAGGPEHQLSSRG